MNNKKKIIAGIIAGLTLTSSLAFADNSNSTDAVFPNLPHGPIYQMVNSITQEKTGMDLPTIKNHIKAHDLKETLQANGVDVASMQKMFGLRAKKALEANGITLKVVDTVSGVEFQLSSETNQNFLKREILFEARAKYFNEVHPEAGFTLSAHKEANTIYLGINGKTAEATAKIQDRFPVTK